jgi:hypothetical protein
LITERYPGAAVTFVHGQPGLLHRTAGEPETE